jgi:hypothetical protein
MKSSDLNDLINGIVLAVGIFLIVGFIAFVCILFS